MEQDPKLQEIQNEIDELTDATGDSDRPSISVIVNQPQKSIVPGVKKDSLWLKIIAAVMLGVAAKIIQFVFGK